MLPLPTEFIEQTLDIYGKELGQQIIDSLNTGSSLTSLRTNPNLNTVDLSYILENTKSIPWLDSGYYLSSRPDFKNDSNFQNGCYYPQESSSMIMAWLAKYLSQKANLHLVLDLCSAPGGKSLLLADSLPESLVISNEIDPWRNQILTQTVAKWQSQNIICTRHKPAELSHLKDFFDLILVDAPCSGEGMFRKDPESIAHWSPKNVEICQTRQKQIIYDIFASLNVGGYLIYSTCTLNNKENEEVINWLTQTLPCKLEIIDNLPEDSKHQFVQLQDGCYHLIPPFSQGEGFFFAVVRKTEDWEHIVDEEEQEIWKRLKGRKLDNDYFRNQKQVKHIFLEEKKQEVILKIKETYPDLDLDRFTLICQNNLDYFLFPRDFMNILPQIQNLKVTRWAVPLGQMRSRDIKTWKPLKK
jgi:16S rRNA C967 or C1407 C5-methylase (RsmB/RsmF family)